MILKSLYDYAQVAKDKLPPDGLERKEIEFLIIINRDGRFIRFETTKNEKNKEIATFPVAKAVQRTVATKPNILWDNGKYVLGLNERDQKAHSMFVDVIEGIRARHKNEIAIEALSKFYSLSKEERLAAFEKDPLFPKVMEGYKSNFSFQLLGERKLIAERKDLFEHLIGNGDEHLPKGRCLVTGEYGPIVRTTTPTPLPDNSPMAALVAFQVRSGYDSYGKSQAFNSPISVKADRAISAVLKLFLGKKSKNKARVGDRMYLFWGSMDSDIDHLAEKEMHSTLNSYDGKRDNKYEDEENEGTNDELVGGVFEGIFNGKIYPPKGDRFQILGLAPNTGRIAVVLWQDTTLTEIAEKILMHQNEMMLGNKEDQDERKPSVGVYSIVSAVSLDGKITNAENRLLDETVRSIIYGLPYPVQLMTRCLERIKAELHERTVTLQRAAILKAVVNRGTRNNQQHTQLQPMLDKTNTNVGYLCGRLAAVLEKIQTDVHMGNSIRTRYIGAASVNPSAIFPTMLRLSGYHMEKLPPDNPKVKVFYDRLKDEIVGKLKGDFPRYLSAYDQSCFFVGYHHQRDDFYTKREQEPKQEQKQEQEQ